MSAKRSAKPPSKPKAGRRREPRRTAPTVDIQVQSHLWDAQPMVEQTVRTAIAAAAAELSTSGGEVGILLTDDSAVRALNRNWRGLDQPTNVLSFPAPKAMAADDAGILGDIVVAYETLKRECDDEGRDLLHHLAHLTVHGYLHLIGYDHQTDAQANTMERLESKVMARMNLPDPWQDRELVRDFGDA